MLNDSNSRGAVDLTELKTVFGFKGIALTESDPGFEEAVIGDLWNQLQPARHPQAVVRVADEEDVVAAVRFARTHGLKVAVRGGGHNWCAPSQRNSGLLIDLANLNQVISIDAATRTAVIQPIVTNREVQAALNPLGLSYPTGHCPTVKISGYLLSGGMAWNHGVWGPGVGSVEAIEIVDSNGDMINASAVENADYFWAARGSGPGFFGIVTRYHLKLHPLPRAITASVYLYPYESIVELAEWLGPLARLLPSSVELSLWAVHAPTDLAEASRSSNGKVAMVTATMFADSTDEARSTLAMLEDSPLIDRCLSKSAAQPTTFQSLLDSSGALWPVPWRSKVDALFYNSPLADVIRATKDHIVTMPSSKTVFMLAVFTGADGAPATPLDAAFSMTGALYGGSWTMWDDAAEDAANIAWHDEAMRLLKPYVAGHYVGETDTVGHPEYLPLSFTPENWQRLADLRRKYDPEGRFFNFTEGLA